MRRVGRPGRFRPALLAVYKSDWTEGMSTRPDSKWCLNKRTPAHEDVHVLSKESKKEANLWLLYEDIRRRWRKAEHLADG